MNPQEQANTFNANELVYQLELQVLQQKMKIRALELELNLLRDEISKALGNDSSRA